MKQTLLRLWIFLCLWRSRHYDEIIDAGLAWELSRIFMEYDEELSQWQEFKS